ncbi:TPA: hypothetical protein ACKRQA_003127 [Proteus mirabilis]|nr:hypothetical protein DR94_3660 [Proteus mirabilis]
MLSVSGINSGSLDVQPLSPFSNVTVFELPSSSSKVTSTESPLLASFGKSIETEPSSSAVNPGLLGAVISASLPLLLSPP